MEKIAILRWESGHVPQGLMQLEQLPGNSTNLASYPFPVKLWIAYAAVFCAVTALVFLTPNLWLLRWAVGGLFGIFELLRIRKRRVLI